jgi:Protein of unknown function (DUF3040)
VLNDIERRTLLDLERQLGAEDPDLAESFQRELHPSAAPSRLSPTGQFAITAALVLSVILFLVGIPSAAVACAVTTILVWLQWRYSGGLDGAQD